jgi:magnesium transporter
LHKVSRRWFDNHCKWELRKPADLRLDGQPMVILEDCNMIRARLIDHADGAVLEGGIELLEAWSQARQTLWLDLENEAPDAERSLLESRFGISPLAVDDAQRQRHPPKLELFDGYLFLLLKGFSAETDSIDFSVIHISFFCGHNFLVTRHTETSPSINRVWEEIGTLPPAARTHPGHLMYKVVRTIINRYSPIVLNLERRLEQLEEQMLERASDDLLNELVVYNSRLRKLRRIFGYQQVLMMQLKGDGGEHLQQNYRHEFQDAYEQMERLASLSDMLQQLTVDLMNGYISVASHRLNNIMKTLTIASVIFLPLTFLAGIYGMNFEYMPELRSHTGYFMVIGAMFTIAVALLVVFRRKRWI